MSKKILLADDSVTIQKVVSITLAHEDFELTIVDNGTEAVAKANELRPDVILLDVVMPDKDGYEVCQEIKASDGLAKIPVILLTGTFEPFDEDRAAEVGADDFIKKPFESHSLVNKIKEMVFKGGARAPVRAAETEIDDIGGLDDLEGIDDLGDFDEFKTPTEDRAYNTSMDTQDIELSEGGLDSTDFPVEEPFDTIKPKERILRNDYMDSPPKNKEPASKDDIWSVEEYDDLSGGGEPSDIGGTDELWGDEDHSEESDTADSETMVIEETRIPEEHFTIGDETDTPLAGETGFADDGFELGDEISMGDLETGTVGTRWDEDVDTREDIGREGIFSEDTEKSSFVDEEVSLPEDGAFGDDRFGEETSGREIELNDVEYSDEMPGDTDDFPVGGSREEDSIELDWGDESDAISGSGDDFAFNGDMGVDMGDMGGGFDMDKPSRFESAPSEKSFDEVDWNMEGTESESDSFGGFDEVDDTMVIDMGEEPVIGTKDAMDFSGDDLDMGEIGGRAKEISRMVKERVIEEGVIPDAVRKDMSEGEVATAVDKIAREIVQKVVWEVVPELAEELIKDEIRRLKGEKNR
ncbi:MAG: response regulator [Deltaproteobacteria bacterium]|uniref:Response regulator n=1 Tax=Candidatus Zymogenus saltonus TaxID=2844893 RepID=A0A9D8KHA1_9DELT|nr:response regulator [Candidatus Zymogenus saltonus]